MIISQEAFDKVEFFDDEEKRMVGNKPPKDYLYKDSYYALLLCIIKNLTISEALSKMKIKHL